MKRSLQGSCKKWDETSFQRNTKSKHNGSSAVVFFFWWGGLYKLHKQIVWQARSHLYNSRNLTRRLLQDIFILSFTGRKRQRFSNKQEENDSTFILISKLRNLMFVVFTPKSEYILTSTHVKTHTLNNGHLASGHSHSNFGSVLLYI